MLQDRDSSRRTHGAPREASSKTGDKKPVTWPKHDVYGPAGTKMLQALLKELESGGEKRL